MESNKIRKKEPFVSIIIINFNGGDIVHECIRSIYETVMNRFEIILIDNKSSDNSSEKCKKKWPEIKLIQNEKKLVYNQSWNKLDKGLKINRLKDFVQREGQTRSLKNVQKEELKQLLISACKNNRLNRLSDINYNIEEGRIESIKVLDYKDDSGYILKLPEIKPAKTSGKSKSNIERFIRK